MTCSALRETDVRRQRQNTMNSTIDNEMEYSIRFGYNEMDFDKITFMLKDAFWSIGIKKNEVIQGAQNSALLVGAFTSDNIQIGFSRVISDKTRFAYIIDVIVEEKYRKKRNRSSYG